MSNLNLGTLKFFDYVGITEFIISAELAFRIMLVSPGLYVTMVSDDGGNDFKCITNGEDGVIYYGSFAEALEAVVEHHRNM